ncbi:MAG TPA: dihydroorotate dehydrogenase [Spirochaetaceae bacterium]|jgi:dihydroorotate dehydrogenase (NAD+) catalytic subunit|nr:dihydroorotate dehydrogenase [Spirochaetaceae bacterium]
MKNPEQEQSKKNEILAGPPPSVLNLGYDLNLSVRIGSLIMPNPVGVASGTFGYGEEYDELVHINALGALYTKAVTLEPREGNPPPRLVETPMGLINSIGLANPGVEKFLREKLPSLRTRLCPIIVNVAGSTEDDYIQVIERIEAHLASTDSGRPGIDGYEINVSCPNVQKGGMSFGIDPRLVERLTHSLRQKTSRPLIIKLSPNVTDIAEIARAAEAGGADAISCINTVVGMVIDTEKMKPAIAMGTGGLSGPAIRPIGVAATYKVGKAVRIPVIGLGGITNASDAIQYLLAGALAVQVGTALFSDPRAPLKVLDGIIEWMKRHSVHSVSDIRFMLR